MPCNFDSFTQEGMVFLVTLVTNLVVQCNDFEAGHARQLWELIKVLAFCKASHVLSTDYHETVQPESIFGSHSLLYIM